MLSPVRVDAAVDLAYGALIVVAIVLIATLEFGIGLAFGLGVFAAYVVHVVWKMARFDPDWMTSAVEEQVEQTVGETVEQKMEETATETVGEEVERTVEETVGEQLDAVQQQVEAVDERVDRRPRGEEIEDIVRKSVDEDRSE